MKHITKFFTRAAILLLLLGAAAGTNAKDIVIYHTTDMHGHFFSRTDKNGKAYGGFARLAALVNQTSLPHLLLDGGDFSSGSYEANQSGGVYSIDLMNQLGYAALTIGNHDSDFGDEGLSNMLSRFNGDVLAMNMSGLSMAKPIKAHAVYDVDGIKVGVIGIAMDGSGVERMKIVNTPSTQDFEAQLKAVKANGAAVIVILAHDSLLSDESVSADKRSTILGPLTQADGFYDIGLMLGGHAHTQRLVGKITDKSGKGPYVLEGGPYIGSVSKVVIHQDDKTGKITVQEPQFITLNGPEDPQVKKFLDTIRNTELDNSLYARVPQLITKYPAPASVDRAPAVARLMAEQMYKAISPLEKIDLTAFSLNSTRSDYKPGELTGRYFAEMAPYEEHAGTFDITGEHLLRAMQESLGYRDGKCFSVYGYSPNVRISFTCNQGHPVIHKATINGKKIKPKRTYRMAMLTHLPRGFYEGKPFQIMPSDAADDGTLIKHYRQITNAAMLFSVIKQFKEEQQKDVPDFVAPKDVQIMQKDNDPVKSKKQTEVTRAVKEAMSK